VNTEARNLHQQMKLAATPLNRLKDADLCPGSAALHRVNNRLR
jgi:2-oxoglutarate/2-oxoacid ferredoxin oxidoreductase subunit beta